METLYRLDDAASVLKELLQKEIETRSKICACVVTLREAPSNRNVDKDEIKSLMRELHFELRAIKRSQELMQRRLAPWEQSLSRQSSPFVQFMKDAFGSLVAFVRVNMLSRS
jgi:uncharacterized protein YktB (UPF0637 family)